jgi:hypothetical protein
MILQAMILDEVDEVDGSEDKFEFFCIPELLGYSVDFDSNDCAIVKGRLLSINSGEVKVCLSLPIVEMIDPAM